MILYQYHLEFFGAFQSDVLDNDDYLGNFLNNQCYKNVGDSISEDLVYIQGKQFDRV